MAAKTVPTHTTRFPYAAVGIFVLCSVWVGAQFGPQPLTVSSMIFLCILSLRLASSTISRLGKLVTLLALTSICLLYHVGCWHGAIDLGIWSTLILLLFWPIPRKSAGTSSYSLEPSVKYWPWYTRPVYWIDKYVFSLRASKATLDAIWDASDKQVEKRRAQDPDCDFEQLFGKRADLDSIRNRGGAALDRAVLQNPKVSPVGSLLARFSFSQFLKRRGTVIDYYLAHRQQIQQSERSRVVAPFIITGLPRTGSTLLQRLLACDPNSRSVRSFELETPLPPMAENVNPLDDPRLKSQKNTANLLEFLAPGMLEQVLKSHPWAPAEPEEELHYCLHQHGILPLWLSNETPDEQAYYDWLLDPSDKQPVFKFLHRFLEMLSYARPTKQWVLKTPPYCIYPQLAMNEFPDARFIITHRNPLTVVASRAKLSAGIRSGFHEDYALDKRHLGSLSKSFCRKMALRVLKYRQRHPEQAGQFFDVTYKSISEDPVGTVRRIYDYYGLQFTEEHRENILALMERDPRVSNGRNTYSLEEFGLTAAEIEEEFEPYMKQHIYTS